jgi:hypothetical protein
MTIKHHKRLFVLLAFSFILLNNACKKEDKDDREIFYFSDYFPLEEGNFWIYRTYRVNRNGQVESIRSFHDSIYIKGDTLINGLMHKVIWMNHQISHIVRREFTEYYNHQGLHFLSNKIFDQTLDSSTQYFSPMFSGKIYYNMRNRNVQMSTEAGSFNTNEAVSNVFYYYEDLTEPYPIKYEYVSNYAPNVGLIRQELIHNAPPNTNALTDVRVLIRYGKIAQ